MLDVLLQLLPFFALIGLGLGAAKLGMFDAAAGRALTKFVFYFALSALLFRFVAGLDMAEILDFRVLGGYLAATLVVYLLVSVVAVLRGQSLGQIAVESQCAVIGNVGFLGLPMLTMLMGEAAALPILQVLTVDLVVFSSLIVILFSVHRHGRVTPAVLRPVGRALIGNPMIVAIAAGLAWSALALPIPGPMEDTLRLLGNAATPGALFAIGVSLATSTAERLSVAAWLSLAKLVLHPLAVAVAVYGVFHVPPFEAGVIVATAALPVAGNVFILAQSYDIAPGRASTAILVSTLVSILTLSVVLALTL